MRTSGPPWSGKVAGPCAAALGIRRSLAVVVLSLLASAAGGTAAADPPPADTYLEAALGRVIDGDTIAVQLASGPLTVRLHGIDAPEPRQADGPAATKALRSLLEGELLEIEPVDQSDSYGRMVARVRVAGDDINARMVEKGYAWAYRQYLRRLPGDERYCHLEAAARAAGRGLWGRGPALPEPPGEFRARGRGQRILVRDWRAETAALCIVAIGEAPAGCRIKGNINTRGDRIYHVPGSPSYPDTQIDVRRGERWFCSSAEAEAAGWRAPRR